MKLHKNTVLRRCAAMLLAVLMCVSLFNLTAFADDVEETVAEPASTPVVEVTPETTSEADVTPQPTSDTPAETPAVTEEPGEMETPAVAGDPAGTEAPAATEGPAGTEAPAATEGPAGTEAPAATEGPAGTEAPAAAEGPAGTEAPAATGGPTGTEAPAVTTAPAESTAPAGTTQATVPPVNDGVKALLDALNEDDEDDKDGKDGNAGPETTEEPASPAVTVTVDGVELEKVPYTEGKAMVTVEDEVKTLITVTVDGQVVLDQSSKYGSYGTGESLLKTWSHEFTDGKEHNVQAAFGYKLTVKTRYVNSEGTDGTWDPSGSADPSAPTFYTIVVPAGDLASPVHLLPLPSADGKYPLRLLDYSGISHPGMNFENITAVYGGSYLPGSDDPNVWIQQGPYGDSSHIRYCLLKSMIEGDTEVELQYNYSKIATFVGAFFEKPDGSWVMEEYSEGSPEHLKNYHCQDTLVDEAGRVTFDPSINIFGDVVKYPEGASAENYGLYGTQVFTDRIGNYQYINYHKWSAADNANGAAFFQRETGLTFDPATGKVDGTLINAIDARNIIMVYYYQLKRPVIYDANGGEGTMETYQAVRGEEIPVAENAFSRDGYTFTGWNTEADGSGTAYAAGDSLKVDAQESVTLYAQWSPVSIPIAPPVIVTRNLTVNKVWVGDGETGARPDSIQVQLYQGGSAYGSPVTLNASNAWSHTWIGLSTVGDLTVKELNVPDGYTASTSISGSTVTITNTYEEDEIEDPDTPLGTPKPTPTPTPDPGEDIDDPDVPLGPNPGEPTPTPDPGEDIEDPDVPLGPGPVDPDAKPTPAPGTKPTPKPADPSAPDDGEEIPDENVPLSNTPKTGDGNNVWMMLALVSAAGLVFLGFSRKRKGENVR